MIGRFVLPAPLRAKLEQEAKRAFPRECCGLIEGIIETGISGLSNDESDCVARATALHPAPNLAAAPDRFEIDPVAHFALLRGLRGTHRAIIGCYHSHPNGRAEPSPRDISGAAETGFLWLIVALESAEAPIHLACFAWTGFAFAKVRMI
ncbi:MAG TPA: M67 family metallopeptidase [Rhizomicrobium sp.]|jgi:proteasome lid subunit RPN8/RPN11